MSWLTRSRGAARLVAPVTGLLLLGACTGGTPSATESATPPATVSPSPTPTPTPTETPAVDVTVKPTRPAALDEPPSVDGAVAVAEYFLLLYPYVYATGDLADWTAMSEPECIFCASVVSNATSIFDKNQHSEGGAVNVLSARGTEVDPGSWYSAQIETLESASATVAADGSVVEDFPGDTHMSTSVIVLWTDGRWSIRGVNATEVAEG
jgi:hypothetical protein